MANLYESDNFNIVSVHEKVEVVSYYDGSSDTYTHLLIKVQRLPLDQYPDLTEVYMYGGDYSPDITKDEFLSLAPSIITSKLAEYDSSFVGEEVSLTATDTLTQKFND